MDPRALAEQIGRAIKETPEYQAVQSARAKLDGHEAARIMLADFKRREAEYRKALIEGKAGEDQAGDLRRLAEILGCNPYVRELLAAEAQLAQLVMDLQNRMMTTAGLIEPAAEGGTAGDAQDS